MPLAGRAPGGHDLLTHSEADDEGEKDEEEEEEFSGKFEPHQNQ